MPSFLPTNLLTASLRNGCYRSPNPTMRTTALLLAIFGFLSITSAIFGGTTATRSTSNTRACCPLHLRTAMPNNEVPKKVPKEVSEEASGEVSARLERRVGRQNWKEQLKDCNAHVEQLKEEHRECEIKRDRCNEAVLNNYGPIDLI
jgi:hypothetical protein